MRNHVLTSLASVIAILVLITFFSSRLWDHEAPSGEVNHGIERSQGRSATAEAESSTPFRPALSPAETFSTPAISLTWEPRFINGVRYVFGSGNPREVVPQQDDYATVFDFVHDDVVTPEVEQQLLAFLSNPALESTIRKCGLWLRPDAHETDSAIVQGFPMAIFSADFSLSNVLVIDASTRWQKKLDSNRLTALTIAFAQWVADPEPGEQPLIERCLSQEERASFAVLSSQLQLLIGDYTDSNMEKPM
jgi:hypothetical protein